MHPLKINLLGTLPRRDYRRLLARLEPVALSFGEVLAASCQCYQIVKDMHESAPSAKLRRGRIPAPA